MRALFLLVALAAVFLTACASPVPEPLVPLTPISVSDTILPTATYVVPPPQRRPVLRVAILGEPTLLNVWAFYDNTSANYWDNATQSGYWPTLYRLAPPDWDIQPATAKGAPPSIICDPANCTATVSLQPGLTWSDGSPFSASDVVFTINTALKFRLGFNWQQAYNPDLLDRAEALNAYTVKLTFKSAPSVADWQYGVLQGPIVNRTYWQPMIAEAVNLLPDETVMTTIGELEDEIDWTQSKLAELNLALKTMDPGNANFLDLTRQARSLDNNLVGLYNKLEKDRTEYDTRLADARASLFSLTHFNEPTLGPWKFASIATGGFENQAHLGTPYGNPWFDRVQYVIYLNEAAAVNALINAEVDLILTPDGLSPGTAARLANIPDVTLRRNMTSSARFLAFNHANPFLADPTLHQALACMLDLQALAERMGSYALPLPGFVLDGFWQNKQVYMPCTGASEDARLTEAIGLLKQAGYTWEVEPRTGANGSGLRFQDGAIFPDFSLLIPAQDHEREAAAIYIAQQANKLGMTLDVRRSSFDDILYTVYGSRDYDMALLGWHLSSYPAYLCDWFTPSGQNPFAYNGSRPDMSENEGLSYACRSWAQLSNLETAQAWAFQAQSILMRDLPLIPLYADARVDAYRNVRYPFREVVDGLGGLYGAPGLAIPIP